MADQALADQLLDQLRKGADFAVVAAGNSTDTSNKDAGGDLGCNAKGAFVPEFEAAVVGAKDGDLVGPVKTDYGYHIIKVTSTYKVRALDDAVKTEIGELLQSPRGWLDFRLAQVKISVSRELGTWDATQTKVLPPEGAAPRPTTPPITAAPGPIAPATGATGAPASSGATAGTGTSATTGATGSGASGSTGR